MLYSKDLILKLGKSVDCELINEYFVSSSMYKSKLNNDLLIISKPRLIGKMGFSSVPVPYVGR